MVRGKLGTVPARGVTGLCSPCLKHKQLHCCWGSAPVCALVLASRHNVHTLLGELPMGGYGYLSVHKETGSGLLATASEACQQLYIAF